MTKSQGRAVLVASLLMGSMVGTGNVWAQANPPQQPVPKQQTVPKVESVAARPIVSVEGKDNFQAYCAVCHGADAKGDGPAAPAMKAAVPDLTAIAQRNNGKFDALSVEYVIKGTGKTQTPAHGVETMPIWGDVFSSEDRPRAALRVKNLVDYLRSIQVKAGEGK